MIPTTITPRAPRTASRNYRSTVPFVSIRDISALSRLDVYECVPQFISSHGTVLLNRTSMDIALGGDRESSGDCSPVSGSEMSRGKFLAGSSREGGRVRMFLTISSVHISGDFLFSSSPPEGYSY